MKKKLINTAIAAAIIITTTGCAYHPKYEMKEGYSRAYSLAKAGGLREGIMDHELTTENGTPIVGGSLWTAADAWVSYNSPVLFTDWGSMGMALLGGLLRPPTHAERNSLFAWMPISDPNITDEEARDQLYDIVGDSIQKAIKHTGGSVGGDWDFKPTPFRNYKKGGIQIINETWGCPEKRDSISGVDDARCYIYYRVSKPHFSVTVNAPSFIKEGQEKKALFFSGADDKEYNRIFIENYGKNAKIPLAEMYSAISEALPGWAYMYLSMKGSTMKNGDSIPAPVVLESGQPEFFIKPI